MTEPSEGAVLHQERIDAWKKRLLAYPLPVVWRFMYYALALLASERYDPSVELAEAMKTMAQLVRGELPELAEAHAELTEHYYCQFAALLGNFDPEDRAMENWLIDTLCLYRGYLAEAEGRDVPKVTN